MRSIVSEWNIYRRLEFRRTIIRHCDGSKLIGIGFSLKALCWYDLTMTQEDFDEKEEVTKSVNHWATDVVKKSVELIAETGDSEESDKNYLPIAGTV